MSTATLPQIAVTRDDDAPAGLSDPALGVLLLTLALSVIDFFIVNVTLPTMGRDLHASDALLELVVSGYGLAYALLLVVGGRLGDAIGRRRLLLIGVAAFTVTSLAAGVAPDIAVLIVARVAQGAAAAMMVPQVMASIHASTEGDRRARAMGMYGATAGLAMVVGQILGGVIVSANVAGSGWRGVFLVNVPVGLIALVLARRLVPETRSDQPAGVDRSGTLLLAATLVALLLPLTEGSSLGWPWWSWVLLGSVPVFAGAWVRTELHHEAAGRLPLVPPSLLRGAGMRRGLLVAVPFFMAFGGFMFEYAIASQEGLHLRPVIAGVALAPYAVAFLVASLNTARWTQRFGNAVPRTGSILQAAGLVIMIALLAGTWPHPSWAAFGAAFLVVGFGQGLVASPLFRILLADVPTHLAGAGTGVTTTTQQSSLAIGVAVLGTLFTSLVGPLGWAGAGEVVCGLQAVIAAGVAVASRALPDLRG